MSNMFDFFLTASRGQFLTKSSPHTVRKRLSKPPREAVCPALSSPCAVGFSVLNSGASGSGSGRPWPGTLCCVLGQDT